jgi:hypothetical protein
MTDPVFAVHGVVFDSSWGRLPVTNMFDVDGQPTDDLELAFVIVAIMPDGKWLSTEVRPGELQRGALS